MIKDQKNKIERNVELFCKQKYLLLNYIQSSLKKLNCKMAYCKVYWTQSSKHYCPQFCGCCNRSHTYPSHEERETGWEFGCDLICHLCFDNIICHILIASQSLVRQTWTPSVIQENPAYFLLTDVLVVYNNVTWFAYCFNNFIYFGLCWVFFAARAFL